MEEVVHPVHAYKRMDEGIKSNTATTPEVSDTVRQNVHSIGRLLHIPTHTHTYLRVVDVHVGVQHVDVGGKPYGDGWRET